MQPAKKMLFHFVAILTAILLCDRLSGIVVDARRPELLPLSADILAEFGAELSLFCGLQHGTKPVTIEWHRDGDRLKANGIGYAVDLRSISATINFDRLNSGHSGNYTCVASNVDGTDRRSTMLHVKGNMGIKL